MNQNPVVINDYGYMTNTTDGPLQFTLPADPVEGDTFAVVDAMGTFGTNNATLIRSGKKILGEEIDLVLNTDGMSLQLVYDGVDNWISVNNHDHDSLVNWVADKHRLITMSEADAAGGSEGDIHIRIF